MFFKAKQNRRRQSASQSQNYGKLENRKLMAAGIFYDAASDLISIQGTGGNDFAQVKQQSNGSFVVQTWGVGSPNYRLVNSPVSLIKFSGGNGNDYFYNNTNVRSIAYGSAGNDTLIGGSNRDEFHGWTGNDWIYGLAGNDLIYGAHDNDVIYGGWGDDTIHGYTGQDKIYAGGGNDYVTGGDGNDIIYAETGNDYVHGGSGDDTIYGQSGNDRLYGSTGDDLIDGGLGNDLLAGWTGNDRLYGSNGNDTIYGQDGNDSLRGGTGSDKLYSGNGFDRFLDRHSSETWDKSSSRDVQLLFYNNGSSWTYKEVSQMDEAFKQLVDRTGTNILLRDTRSNNSLRFYKEPANGSTLGYNEETTYRQWNFWKFRWDYSYSRRIVINDYNENNAAAADQAIDTMIHEIGHNWDSTTEIRNGIGNGQYWGDFTKLSNWTTTNKSGYSKSGDGRWYFRASNGTFSPNLYTNSAGITMQYGKHNPVEDWATMWEEYFDRQRNPRFELTGTPLQPKLNVLDSFFSRASRYA